MNQYAEQTHPALQQLYADAATVCTKDLFVLTKEEEDLRTGHVAYTFNFATTEAGTMAQQHVSELMEQEDSYNLDLWLDAMADELGVDHVSAPGVHNDRIEFTAVAWA